MTRTTRGGATVERRARRTRAKLRGSAERPRLSVFRSNRGLYVQLIDDQAGHTLAAASSRDAGSGDRRKGVASARLLGRRIAELALRHGIRSAAFDRGAYRYHGAVRAIAEGAREGGLKV